jgi:hypothetical protein
MPFMEKIRGCRSLSIVGLEKNTGKTVSLNYVLGRLAEMGISSAVTSIGVDGEQTDSVYATAKPEVRLYEGMRFITSERHYRMRRLVSEIEWIDKRRTALGRLVTARVLSGGMALLSGAAATGILREQIEEQKRDGVELTVVDGALSRLSLASPTVTDAMILATGAAVSPNLQQLVSKTRFVVRMIGLDEVTEKERETLSGVENGLWALDGEGVAHDLGVRSVFMLSGANNDLYRYGTRLFASGAVSDRLLKMLAAKEEVKDTTLIVRDFTKLFITPEVYADYTKRGGELKVLQRSRLVALTLNPTSPHGYAVDSEKACGALEEALGMPVYDVRRENCMKRP